MRAVYVGDCTDDERAATDTCAGKYQLVYMSPEALLTNEQWRDMQSSAKRGSTQYTSSVPSHKMIIPS